MEELDHPAPDTLHKFIAAWYGPRRPEYGIRPEHLGAPPLPPPLRTFYELAGRWPGLIGQNRLLGPSELEDVDGRVFFYVENQGVWLWAIDREGEDPAFWSRENVAGAVWELEGERLSRFLLQVVLFEAMWGMPKGASTAWLTEAQLREAVRPLRPLSLAPWRWPGYPGRFNAGEGVIAFSCTNPYRGGPKPSDYYSLLVGAQRPEPLAYLAPVVDDTWDSAVGAHEGEPGWSCVATPTDAWQFHLTQDMHAIDSPYQPVNGGVVGHGDMDDASSQMGTVRTWDGIRHLQGDAERDERTAHIRGGRTRWEARLCLHMGDPTPEEPENQDRQHQPFHVAHPLPSPVSMFQELRV